MYSYAVVEWCLAEASLLAYGTSESGYCLRTDFLISAIEYQVYSYLARRDGVVWNFALTYGLAGTFARFLINFMHFGCIHLPPGERYVNVLLVTHKNKWQELLPCYFKDENKISLLFKISKCTVNFKFLHIHDKNGRGLISL